MKRILLAMTCAALPLMSSTPILAQSQTYLSGNNELPGCRDLLAGRFMGITTTRCLTITTTLAELQPLIDMKLRACMPNGVIPRQMVAIIIQYADRNPKQLHLPLSQIAQRALREAWPCT